MANTIDSERKINSERKMEVEAMEIGTATEAIAGAVAIILTILGLTGVIPVALLSIATIAVGAGLLFQGSTIAAEYTGMLNRVSGDDLQRLNLGGGLSIEMLGGGIGVALGILSLLGLAPHVLLPISAIVLGCAVAFSSTTISRLNNLKITTSGVDSTTQHIAGGAVDAASGAQVLIGLGAAVLGILSLIGISAMTLAMIALLALGFSILLSGLSISGRAFKTL